MGVEEILTKSRRQHQTVSFHRVVETVEVALKSKTHRIEIFTSGPRFGYNLLELRETADKDISAWHLVRYTKAEYTDIGAALVAVLHSLGYRM